MGKRSNRVLVMKVSKLLMMVMVASFSDGFDSVSADSTIAVRGSTILTGRTGVSSVTWIFLKLGHARDHAGWGPLQVEQEGSFAGHLFGRWLSGQMGLLVQSA
jgi:hypothetical protein